MYSTKLGSTEDVGPSFLGFATVAGLSRRDRLQSLGALTIAAHDLRGPLANLALLVESIEVMAQDGDVAGLEARKQRAYRLIEHLDGVIAGMLRRVRTKGDPLRFSAVRLDLAEIVGAALDLNRPMADRRCITLRYGGCDGIAVNGDRGLLVEAIDNILNNAIRHSEAGTTIDCAVSRQAGAAAIRVRDQGCGLTDVQMRRLFRPFAPDWSGDAGGGGASRHKGGTGLGLWIARLIAARHGGHIEVSSRGVDLGATFELHLPLAGKRCNRHGPAARTARSRGRREFQPGTQAGH